MFFHYCIIGGGIAGVTAAETIREHDPTETVAVISDEEYPLYSRVLLPSYVKGDVERNRVFLRTIADFEKKEISLFLGRTVRELIPDERLIILDDGTRLSFNKLLIASGGTPKPWQAEGGNKKGIFRLHTIGDAEAVRRAVPDVHRAVVVGDKFIALEFLEIFRRAGIPTTLVSKNKNMFGSLLDSPGVKIVHEHLQSHKVELVFEDEIALVEGKEQVERVLTKNGMSFPADAIGVGIGLQRNFNFLHNSGVAVGGSGVLTNSFLETNVPGVYAAGDIAEYDDVILESRHVVGNWAGAFLQGKIAGTNMAAKISDGMREFKFVPFYSIMNFGMNMTFLGSLPTDYTESISRSAPLDQRYERFFLKDGRLVGAVLMNSTHDKPILAQLVEKRVSLETTKDRMTDMSFDIATLL